MDAHIVSEALSSWAIGGDSFVLCSPWPIDKIRGISRILVIAQTTLTGEAQSLVEHGLLERNEYNRGRHATTTLY